MKKVFNFTPAEVLDALTHDLFTDGVISLNEYHRDGNKLFVLVNPNDAVTEFQVEIDTK